ncbi:DUF5063 domain-containing protein [Piscinibacter terrae]|nr:DUF5063 domain-containing protein [Albitalea terrae]
MDLRAHRKLVADRFSAQARRFVEWADGTSDAGPLTAPVALRQVVAVYTAALAMPQPWSEHVSPRSEEQAVDMTVALSAVRLRAAAIPLQHYSEIFSPLVPQDEPVVGDLADDLVDIYRHLARGLQLHAAGLVDDALWEWGFNFQVHWGEHASSAIRALHCYLAQEDPTGLCSGD